VTGPSCLDLFPQQRTIEGAAQVSPATEDIGDFAAGQSFPNWYTRYQPVSYDITSRSGSAAAFEDMVSRCSAVGVDIIVDVVLNHMAAGCAAEHSSSPHMSHTAY
jgi:alpha-amylase